MRVPVLTIRVISKFRIPIEIPMRKNKNTRDLRGIKLYICKEIVRKYRKNITIITHFGRAILLLNRTLYFSRCGLFQAGNFRVKIFSALELYSYCMQCTLCTEICLNIYYDCCLLNLLSCIMYAR